MPVDPPLLDRPPLRLRACRHGLMLYLTTDRYIGRSLDVYGEFSPGEVELLLQLVKPGDTVVEVGANIGAHTVPLARAVGPHGPVVAIEPQRLTFQLLAGNVAVNQLNNVRTIHAGAGRATGSILVPVLDPAVPQNFGGLALGDHATGDRVPLTPLDALGLERCHLIKIDTEGMELDVLAGAADTLRHRPHLYLENDRADRSADLIAHVLDLGYRLFWHLPPLFIPGNFRGEGDDIFGPVVSVNMLGIHRDRPSQIAGLREITSPGDPIPIGPIDENT